MSYKKLIPGFGYSKGLAVCLNDKNTAYTEDILTLSQYYSDNGADELFLYDMSEDDEEHERAIGAIKVIGRLVDVPLIAGGRIKRLEDVKKYLYAGAKAVYLNVSDEDNIDLMKEAADRFGSEKIYAYLPDMAYLSRIEEFVQLGASMLILDVPELSAKDLEKTASFHVPFFAVCHDHEAAVRLSGSAADGVVLNLPPDSSRNCMKLKQHLKSQGILVHTFESSLPWSSFKKNSDDLIPVIVQDYKTQEVLMMAYMNEEAYEATLACGKMTYFSRSRQKLWLKGETSGHYQYVKSLHLDCDNDTILAKVRQSGAACHTGNRSCFFQTLTEREYRETNPLKIFEEVFHIILDRKEHPKEGSYTNYLFDKGLDKILKKVGEEATEIIIAAKNPDPEEIKYEISDFLYHVMVLMAEKGVTWEEITEELANR